MLQPGKRVQVVGQAHQKLEQANPQTYLGPGKLAELVQLAKTASAETIIFVCPLDGRCCCACNCSWPPAYWLVLRTIAVRVAPAAGPTRCATCVHDAAECRSLPQDDELSPRQLRALDKALGKDVRVCDRTMLILSIFSQRAASREGQLQVGPAAWGVYVLGFLLATTVDAAGEPLCSPTIMQGPLACALWPRSSRWCATPAASASGSPRNFAWACHLAGWAWAPWHSRCRGRAMPISSRTRPRTKRSRTSCSGRITGLRPRLRSWQCPFWEQGFGSDIGGNEHL